MVGTRRRLRGLLERVLPVWRRTVLLSWPMAVQQGLNTLMRTVDIVVAGLFSPAAVAAIGLADLYSDIPRRVGSSIGSGAIALASQDTGRGAGASRDRAVTQALLLGFVSGLPFVLVGLLFTEFLIGVLGAAPDVVRLGAAYLAVIFVVAPMRTLGFVGASALQGTGDTRTPMYINGSANVINIVATVGLGLGVGPFPELGVVGVAIATAIARVYEATVTVLAIASSYTLPALERPRDLAITRQILAIGLPRFAEQMSTSVASFPFNALLLVFGTEVNAAYHIARRIYQQLTGPLYRSFSLAASIVVGQTVGEGDAERARFSGVAIVAFAVLTMGAGGLVLFATAGFLATVFSKDPPTIAFATEFIRAYAVTMVFFGVFFTFSGALRGAGDTRTPFYAQFTGQFGLMVGFSYLVGVVLGYGLPAVYAGIVLTYAWGSVIVTAGFLRGGWADAAEAMIARRAEAETD